MRKAEYPNVDDTAQGEKALDEFRSAFTMTDGSDAFATLRAVDDMLKPFGLEVVSLGGGSDPVFRIDAIVGDGARQTTACCYLDADGDMFMREAHGNGYRWYPKDSFENATRAMSHIGGKPNMDRERLDALCRIAYGESTPEREGIPSSDVYRTLQELGQA